MYTVRIKADSGKTKQFIQASERLHTGLRCCREPLADEVVVAIEEERHPALFRLNPGEGVVVSTWQSAGICLYAGLEPGDYFVLCALLGLIQWHALAQNPMLVAEDFAHPTPSRCLFTSCAMKQDYSLLFEEPYVCEACLQFYRCLGVERGVLALQHALARLAARRARMRA